MATKAELQRQLEEVQKTIDERKAKIKAQNEAAKERWETVSCRLPKGTKARIGALGLTMNGVINESVLAYLERMEGANEDMQEPMQIGQTAKPVSDPEPAATNDNAPAEPQEAPQTAMDAQYEYSPGMAHMTQAERAEWLSVQSAEELQAKISAKSNEIKRLSAV